MALVVRDIIIEQGSDFERHFRWKGADGLYIDLTGWTARMQVRTSFSAPTAVLNATTENGMISLTAAGDILIHVPNATTALLTAPMKGVYDLELVSPGGKVTRFLEGTARVTPEVTK